MKTSQNDAVTAFQATLVSVIMPAYNMQAFIGESIFSVIVQTYANWELIIVDDGSEDATKDICKKYMEADARIKYMYVENGKQGKARNTGIAAAKGELIAFLDADDLWKNDFLEKQLALLENTKADLVFSNIEFINASSVLMNDIHEIEFDELKGKEGIVIMLTKNPVPLSTVMMWKKAILQVGGFRESNKLQHGEDYELWFQLLIHGFVLKGNRESLVFYRKHEGQSTEINDSKYFQRMDIIRNIPASQNLENEKRKAISRWMLRKLIFSKKASKQELLFDADYMPTAFKKSASKIACQLFPATLSRKIMCYISGL